MTTQNKKLIEETFICLEDDCLDENGEHRQLPNRKAALMHYKKTGHAVEGYMSYKVSYGGAP